MDKLQEEMAALKRDLATAQHELAEARAYIRRRILAEDAVGERVSKTDELGKRAVACKGWRWMPGMLASDAGGNRHRVIEHDAGEKYATTVLQDYDDAHVESSVPADAVTPVLSDPATMGCLLALVRDAWGEATVYVEHDKCRRRPWVAILPMLVIDCDTEAEALVAALEAAP